MSDSNAFVHRRLYRLMVESEGVAVQAVLVLTEDGPAAAAALALERVQDRWPDSRARVMRCWSFPPGELALLNADQLELLGTQVDVIDVGWRTPREVRHVT